MGRRADVGLLEPSCTDTYLIVAVRLDDARLGRVFETIAGRNQCANLVAAQLKRESRDDSPPSPCRLQLVMHKKSNQDNNWDGDTQ